MRSCRCCSRRPSITPLQDPGLHQGLSAPASARMADSTPMARLGRQWHSLCRAMATAPANCCRCSTQFTTPTVPPVFSGTRSSPMSPAPMSIRCRRMSGAADGPGTPARPDGCIASHWNGFWGSACRRESGARSLHPAGWPGFEVTFRYRSARYEILVENPLGVCRGILATKLDGEMVTGNKNMLIPLRDDGAVHKVQVVLG